MDIIQQGVSLPPVPCLNLAVSRLESIKTFVKPGQAKQQLVALAQSLEQLLTTLNGEFRAGKLLQTKTETALADLHRFVRFTVSQSLLYTSIAQVTRRYPGFC
jgi:hypothetical protein